MFRKKLSTKTKILILFTGLWFLSPVDEIFIPMFGLLDEAGLIALSAKSIISDLKDNPANSKKRKHIN